MTNSARQDKVDEGLVEVLARNCVAAGGALRQQRDRIQQLLSKTSGSAGSQFFDQGARQAKAKQNADAIDGASGQVQAATAKLESQHGVRFTEGLGIGLGGSGSGETTVEIHSRETVPPVA